MLAAALLKSFHQTRAFGMEISEATVVRGIVSANELLRMYRPDGSKKAYCRLTPDVDALDVAATKLNIV